MGKSETTYPEKVWLEHDPHDWSDYTVFLGPAANPEESVAYVRADVVERLERILAEIGGEWDPDIRPVGSDERWVADIASRARAALTETRTEGEG